jgi:hypothetical protein
MLRYSNMILSSNLTSYISISISVFSTLLAVFALFWNGRQQRKLEELKREQQKEILVHKALFEKEFEVYQIIWSDLTKLYEVFHKISNLIIYQKTIPITQEKATLLQNELVKKHNKFITKNNKHKPFYSIEVFNSIEIIEKKFIDNFKDTNILSRTDEENLDIIYDIMNAMDDTAEVIRIRINKPTRLN